MTKCPVCKKPIVAHQAVSAGKYYVHWFCAEAVIKGKLERP